jgi:hypothetical protein
MENLTRPPTPPATSTPSPGEYTATLRIDPSEPPTPNGIVTITGTLLLGTEHVQGAKMHLTLQYWGKARDADGGTTGPDGTTVIRYNIGRALAQWEVRVVAAFFVDDNLVTRAVDYFTPVPQSSSP